MFAKGEGDKVSVRGKQEKDIKKQGGNCNRRRETDKRGESEISKCKENSLMDYSVVLLSDSSLQTLHLFFVLKV